jgi:hypothetical protein
MVAGRKTCTAHCESCGQHFHGKTAYDAHRREGQCLVAAVVQAKDSRNWLLQVWTAEGWCSLAKGCRREGKVVNWLYPVTIWQRFKPW